MYRGECYTGDMGKRLSHDGELFSNDVAEVIDFGHPSLMAPIGSKDKRFVVLFNAKAHATLVSC